MNLFGKERFLLALLITAAGGAAGQEDKLRDALLETRADIERAVLDLNAARAKAEAERRPLADRLDKLRGEVKNLRAKAERARMLRAQGEQEYQALVDRNARLAETCRFIASLLSEYRRSLETRAGKAESFLFQESLAEVDPLLGQEPQFDGLPGAAGILLSTAAAWNGKKAGGMITEGAAIDAAGIEHAGRFAVFGPLAYFCSSDGIEAGPVVTRLGSVMPAVYEGSTVQEKQQIAMLVEGREALVPVDVTSGDALKVKEARPSLYEHVIKGGFVMIPLLAIGVLAVLLVLWKIMELGRAKVGASPRIAGVLNALRRDDVDSAVTEARAVKEPLRSILLEGIEHRKAAAEHIEEIMEERVMTCVPRLERHLGLLAVLGGVAPLLGLLGTVTGMIHTFQLVTVFGTGDARLLSGGISEALVTTEFGLAIAIPVLLAHALLARRVRTLVERLEDTASYYTDSLKHGMDG